MTGRRRNNLIALSVAAVFTVFCLYIQQFQHMEEKPVLSVSYKTAESTDYKPMDRTTKRLVLDAIASKDELTAIIRQEAGKIAAKNAFIYVYNPGTEIRTGGEWVAMFSRSAGIDQEITFK